MNLKNVYTISAVIGVLFGLVLVLFPAGFLSMYGPDASDALNFTGRLLGSAYIGFAVIAWQVRNASDPDVGNTVLPGFLGWVMKGARR